VLNAVPGSQPDLDPTEQTASSSARLPRVVVCECRQFSDTPVHRLVQSQSWVTVSIDDGNALLAMLSQHGADALVIGLCVESGELFGILRLARRILPGVPLIVLASSASDITEAQIRGLGVTWYGVAPIKSAELKQVVQNAVINRRGGTCAWAAPQNEREPERPINRSESEGDQK
jgi:DNA-binding response OmpR family regulator